MKKRFYVLLSVVLVLVSIVILFTEIKRINTVKFDLSDILEFENPDDISMTIYYIDPSVLTRAPWDANFLIEHCDSKIVVEGNELKQQLVLLDKINSTRFKRVVNSNEMDARIHYVIENKESKLLEVTMWGSSGNSIFVNGIEIEEDFLFYDLIMPFLPDDVAKALK